MLLQGKGVPGSVSEILEGGMLAPVLKNFWNFGKCVEIPKQKKSKISSA